MIIIKRKYSFNLLANISFIFFILSITTSCTHLLFQPLKTHLLSLEELDIDYEDIYLEIDNTVTLHGWKLNTDSSDKNIVLYLHGNGENISTHIANIYWLTKHNYDVYLFDYRGYGYSTGTPDLDNIITDNEVIIEFITKKLIPNQKFSIIGHSLGGSLAVYSVANSKYKDKINSLVTISAFSDYHHITQEVLSRNWLTWPLQYPLSWTINNNYSPLKYIAGVNPVPIVILHGDSDTIVSFEHAKSLYKRAQEPKFIETLSSGHNNVFENKKNQAILLKYLNKR